ncbi:hypothetical protein PRIPAC_92312 [Pristionchus pacificus]|uniref:Uncharacterized protein n=1 Tax=Pristionchus pacificus TaxID=54126 RepID=A0A2A6BQB1_PRIPA|nr:hypothetical protein PRIPAC_92312 [Pristionchus pacificus]|eukprot:PDM68104.1 hypothetical protein PRIPAC_46148 [Pristionchus pacificus]
MHDRTKQEPLEENVATEESGVPNATETARGGRSSTIENRSKDSRSKRESLSADHSGLALLTKNTKEGTKIGGEALTNLHGSISDVDDDVVEASLLSLLASPLHIARPPHGRQGHSPVLRYANILSIMDLGLA